MRTEYPESFIITEVGACNRVSISHDHRQGINEIPLGPGFEVIYLLLHVFSFRPALATFVLM